MMMEMKDVRQWMKTTFACMIFSTQQAYTCIDIVDARN